MSELEKLKKELQESKADFRIMREIAREQIIKQLLPDEVDQEFAKRRGEK